MDKNFYINQYAVVDDNVEIGEGTKVRLKFDENRIAVCEKSGKRYRSKDNIVIEIN